jgi:hypothetical protein
VLGDDVALLDALLLRLADGLTRRPASSDTP